MTGRLVVCFVSLVLLAGCPPTITKVSGVPPTESVPTPVSIDRSGPVRHEASGLAFAEGYGEFRRVSAYRYDAAGLDMSVGYDARSPGCRVVTTFYVYPTPRMTLIGAAPDVVASTEQQWLEREYAGVKAVIGSGRGVTGGALENPVATPAAGAPLRGKSLRLFMTGDLTSELRLFVYDHQWFLKYRFTYPTACEAQAHPQIGELLRALPWAVAGG
jgi:hypothetical protein